MGDEVLCVGLLGMFSISIGDSVIADDAWQLRKAKTLIKLLAVSPERRFHVDQAAELLPADRYEDWSRPPVPSEPEHPAVQGGLSRGEVERLTCTRRLPTRC
jgi:hypothetical protein